MKQKRAFKENVSMILRGYRIIYRIAPRYVRWNIAAAVFGLFAPYFSLYMSSLVINELAVSRDMGRLLLLAGITVGGLFLLNLINRLIVGRRNVYGSDSWNQDALFYLKQENKMQYAHLENPEVILLHEKIYAAKNATGGGLPILFWNINTLISSVGNIIFSISLTITLFVSHVDGGPAGFLGFVNSPYSVGAVILLIAVNAVIAIVATNQETRKVTAAWQSLASVNSRYSAFNKIWGNDAYIFNMHRIVRREEAKLRRPPYISQAQKYKLRYGTLRTIWNHVMTAALFVYVAAKAYLGAFGIGNFVLYRGTIAKFVEGVAGIAEVMGRLMQNNETLADVFHFLDLPDSQYHGTLSVEKRDDIDYEIEFRDVGFRYPRSDTWALRHVSLKFKVGERMAIVGMNGSGKTTLIKLLCRLYDPTEGKILLNGIDITRYRYDEYMRLFSVVFQDYKLFSFTIAQNVSAQLADDREEVLSCLARAGLSERIHEMKKGADTALGRDYENDGIDISGGEAQKIAIARALYKKAPFIILDEPTAALDPLAEAEVYSRFNEIAENKTAIYISHRLSSCRFCDRIVVFHNGELIQSGTHDTLVSEENGKYYELWHAQAQYYTE